MKMKMHSFPSSGISLKSSASWMTLLKRDEDVRSCWKEILTNTLLSWDVFFYLILIPRDISLRLIYLVFQVRANDTLKHVSFCDASRVWGHNYYFKLQYFFFKGRLYWGFNVLPQAIQLNSFNHFIEPLLRRNCFEMILLPSSFPRIKLMFRLPLRST